MTRARPALLLVRASTSTSKARTGRKRFQPGIHFVWMPGFLCVSAASGRVSRQAAGGRLGARRGGGAGLAGRLAGALRAPDFCKESVSFA